MARAFHSKSIRYRLKLEHDKPVKFSVGTSHEAHDQTFMNENLADFGSP
jgi:hypothetical protein